MFNREDFIKFIPKPTNNDVILYDISLKELIDLDVYEEYKKLYAEYESKAKEYLALNKKIDEYSKKVNEAYLYKPSWTEKDYLENLQNDKKTYSILYNDIKKLENTIQISQKKIKSINQKIEIQTAKEQKEIANKKENIYIDIQKNREQLESLKVKLGSYKQDLEHINSQIEENQEDFQLLSAMDQELKLGDYKCKYCGSTVKVSSENSLIFKRLYKNVENNKLELEKLLTQKEKINNSISYYENEIKKVKIELNNNLQYTKQNYNFYQKKSVEILKLEALRDEAMNDISNAQKQLRNNPKLNSDRYKELKTRIDKYELSLENLKDLKEINSELAGEIDKYNKLTDELTEIADTLKKYLQFLTIFFKIYEQKANEYCGNNIKFKFFKIEKYKIWEIIEIKYGDTMYADLDKKTKEKVDKIIIEKFSIFS